MVINIYGKCEENWSKGFEVRGRTSNLSSNFCKSRATTKLSNYLGFPVAIVLCQDIAINIFLESLKRIGQRVFKIRVWTTNIIAHLQWIFT